jgi:hypothetical protein
MEITSRIISVSGFALGMRRMRPPAVGLISHIAHIFYPASKIGIG